MPSIDTLRIETLLQPILQALAHSAHPLNATQINLWVVNHLQWQVDPAAERPLLAQLAEKLAMTRASLTIAGLIKPEERGYWSITEAGVHAQTLPPEALLAILKQAARQASTEASDELKAAKIDYFRSTWQSRLIELVMAMDPDAFERLCQRILRASHFIRVEVTGRSGDEGIDGNGILRVNLLSFHVMFQCKRWRKPVGAPEVRDFRGALTGRAEKGLMFTTSSFTAAAHSEASRPGVLPIDLVDGDALCILLKTLNLGVSVKMVEEINIDPQFFQMI
jgi:restriction system protein